MTTYADNLCMIVNQGLSLCMTPLYNFELKGHGEWAFHVGCGFTCENNGTLLCIDLGK